MKRNAVIVGALLILLAVIARLLIDLAANRGFDSENDSIFVIKKNTTSPEVEVFADEGEECADISPAIWLVSDDEGNSIYMTGSMHALKEEDYPLPDIFKEAFEQADVIAVEINNVDSAGIISDVEVHGSYTCEEGDTLANHLSEETYSALCDYADENGLDMDHLDDLMPWAAYESLEESSETVGEYSATIGLDRVLQLSANIEDKEIYSIETLEEKVNVYCDMPDNVLDLLIYETCTADEEQTLKRIDEQYEAWRTGDLEAVEEYTYSYSEDYTEEQLEAREEYYELFVIERNKRMVERAERMIDEGQRTLFIVGLSHFVGDEGIIALLEADGYTVERVEY